MAIPGRRFPHTRLRGSLRAMEDEPAPAELAGRIIEADRSSGPVEKRLRFQWNVPFGVTPYIPLWFTGVFVLLVVIVILDATVR